MIRDRAALTAFPASAGEHSPARPAAYTLPVLVGLAVVFLIFTAFLGAIKSGALFTEGNLLYAALIFYAAAAALHFADSFAGSTGFSGIAGLAVWLGFAANTLAVGHRWILAGRPPFSNIYEMLLSFVWMLAALTLFVGGRYNVRALGTVTMPLAVLGVILMQVLPSEVRPLVPALQSTWLHVHVTLAMLAYAALAVSFTLALLFLIRDGVQSSSFLIAASALLVATYLGMATRFDASGGLRVIAYDLSAGHEIFLAERTPLYVIIPSLGWLFFLVLAATLAPLTLSLWARWNRHTAGERWAGHAFLLATLFQAAALLAFFLRTRRGLYPSPQTEGTFTTHPAASPFILAGLVAGLFISFLALLLLWRREQFEHLLPRPELLDRLTYKTIGIAFPLLTLMIATGAYWANRTWGSYWSWDPKETWALITWLVYAGYLHMRITRGWRGRRAAFFAIVGFAVVLFTFLGVTYLLPGLHAYA